MFAMGSAQDCRLILRPAVSGEKHAIRNCLTASEKFEMQVTRRPVTDTQARGPCRAQEPRFQRFFYCACPRLFRSDSAGYAQRHAVLRGRRIVPRCPSTRSTIIATAGSIAYAYVGVIFTDMSRLLSAPRAPLL